VLVSSKWLCYVFDRFAKPMIKSPKVKGVVILNSNDTYTPEMFSPDAQCPDYQGPNKDYGNFFFRYKCFVLIDL
jgi:hypothetical protein